MHVTLDDLLRAAQAADRNGLMRAGRSLQKHAARQGSSFATDREGARIVQPILGHPNSVRKPNTRGGQDVVVPDGRGVRYNADGIFYSFLEP